MQAGLSTQKTVTTMQHNPTQHIDVVPLNTISVLLTIALPVIAIGAIVAYRKHRATVLRRQIQLLNQLWQLDTSKNLS
jgi:hypothetical protein